MQIMSYTNQQRDVSIVAAVSPVASVSTQGDDVRDSHVLLCVLILLPSPHSEGRTEALGG